jgi:phosphopantothenoylcysteine decarboxylase/phosphopantothenate--cysteine ligase
MFEACERLSNDSDIMVMSAAVADYTPSEVATEKIKKKEETFNLNLVKTKDILKHLGSIKRQNQYLVGFALETNDERSNALKKLKDKKADLLILNSLNDAEAGFGKDTNKVTIFDKDGGEYTFPPKDKKIVAEDIVELIIKKIHDYT